MLVLVLVMSSIRSDYGKIRQVITLERSILFKDPTGSRTIRKGYPPSSSRSDRP